MKLPLGIWGICAAALPLALPAQDTRLLLREKWSLQSSALAPSGGAELSTPGYAASGWYPATVPTTVFAALVKQEVYADPNFGMNLREAAGVRYPIAGNFSNIQMPPESPYRVPWWFRTEFDAPAAFAGKTAWLRFDGLNFRANIWLNGRQIGWKEKVAGAWRLFEFDVTPHLRTGAKNALAVEIFPPEPGDLAITFVDWNPTPPDKMMGLWRDVSLNVSGPVSVRWPHVVTKLKLPAAELAVSAELNNATAAPVTGILKGKVEGLEFQQEVRLGPKERRVVKFAPQTLANTRLWWPAPVGPQNLYTLELQFTTAGAVSDSARLRFGVREVTSFLNANQHRVFQINGKNILIRGAGYTFDMLLRSSPERQRAELRYVRDMNLNAVRLEGKIEDDHFLDLCDEMGILVMPGWCCCDHWEKWDNWDAEDAAIAVESQRDQIRRLRAHPSVFTWLNASDGPPPAEVEQRYVDVLKELDWPNPFQSSAMQQATKVTGETGIKMTGPYDWVPPSYWLTDKTRGGAFGFNTETSPGPSVPPVEGLRQFLPEDHLWPIDSWWNFHAGGGPFRDLKVFTQALTERYGAASGLDDYARKAQLMTYEGHRAMFEAFARNKYNSTGVIQWMLNNAWPGLIWHLYDYYLRPAGAYYGARKACEPLHVQYSYDDGSIVVANSFYESFPGMKVTARQLSLNLTELASQQAKVDIEPDSVKRVLTLPEPRNVQGAYFLQLKLEDAAGKTVSTNFYWLSTKPDVLDWDNYTWYYTPTKSFADMKGLTSLAPVDLTMVTNSQRQGAEQVTRVRVENPSRTLALYVHLRIVRAQGAADDGIADEAEVLPIIWEDNYFALLPGESREVSAAYAPPRGQAAKLAVILDGWNVTPKRLPVTVR